MTGARKDIGARDVQKNQAVRGAAKHIRPHRITRRVMKRNIAGKVLANLAWNG